MAPSDEAALTAPLEPAPAPSASAPAAAPAEAGPAALAALAGARRALREQLDDAPARGAALAAALAGPVDGERVPLVLPAAMVAAAAAKGPERRRRFLADQLAGTYPSVRADGWAGLTGAAVEHAVELVVVDDGGREPLALGDTGDVALRRVALPPGHMAVHHDAKRPTWALVAGFDLVGLASWALLWSYEVRPLVCAALSIVVAATLAGAHGLTPAPLASRSGVRSWPRERAFAARGALVTALLSFLVGLLAVDGLTGRDTLVVLVPMVAAGAWVGGADTLAVAWEQSRRRRPVADVGGTHVLAAVAAPTAAAPTAAATETGPPPGAGPASDPAPSAP